MPPFPITPELDSFHNDVIQYATDLHASFNDKSPLSTFALANIHYMAILSHRGIRTLCEQGWTPLSTILIRTMLDHCASCIAIINVREQADYMGFKYFAPLLMKLSTDPVMTEQERQGAQGELEKVVNRLSATDQQRARTLIKENKSPVYWYSPEYQRPSDLLKLAAVPIQKLYSLFSGPAHGSFSGQVLFNDNSTVQEVDPQAHPQGSKRAIEASSRLLLEISRMRDVWENHGNLADYDKLPQRIVALK